MRVSAEKEPLKLRQSEREPKPREESTQSEQQVARQHLVYGPKGALGGGNTSHQISLMRAKELQPHHGLMAEEIGARQGNQHLQHVLRQVQAEGPSSGRELAMISGQLGNQAMQAQLNESPSAPPMGFSTQWLREKVQPWLQVSQPGDPLEESADAVSAAVMRAGPTGGAGLRSSVQEDSVVPVSPSLLEPGLMGSGQLGVSSPPPPGADPTGADLERRVRQLESGGDNLPHPVQGFFEARMGVDLSGVRVHRDGEAQALSESFGARAFAVGGHVAFNAGEYDPQSSAGQGLMAHELAHVVQQGAAAPLTPATPGAEMPVAQNPSAEQEETGSPSGEEEGGSGGGGGGEGSSAEEAKPIPPRTKAALEQKFNVDLTGATVVGDISRLRSPSDLSRLTLNVNGASFKGSDYDLSTAAGQQKLASDIRAGGSGEGASDSDTGGEAASAEGAEGTAGGGGSEEKSESSAPATPTESVNQAATPTTTATAPATTPGATPGVASPGATGTPSSAAPGATRGTPLPPSVRGALERQFGVDLNGASVNGDISSIRSPQDLANVSLTINGMTFKGSDYNLSTVAGRQQLAQDIKAGGQAAQGSGQASAGGGVTLPTPPKATPTPGTPQEMGHEVPGESERFAVRAAAVGQATGPVDVTAAAETHQANAAALVAGFTSAREQGVTDQINERATAWAAVLESEEPLAAFEAALAITSEPVMAASPLGLPTLAELGVEGNVSAEVPPGEMVGNNETPAATGKSAGKEGGAGGNKEAPAPAKEVSAPAPAVNGSEATQTPPPLAPGGEGGVASVNEAEAYQQQTQVHGQVMAEHQVAHEMAVAEATQAASQTQGVGQPVGGSPSASQTPTAGQAQGAGSTSATSSASGGGQATAAGQPVAVAQPAVAGGEDEDGPRQSSGVGTDPGPRPQMNQVRTATPAELGGQRAVVDQQVGAHVASTDRVLGSDLGQYLVYPAVVEGEIKVTTEPISEKQAELSDLKNTWLDGEEGRDAKDSGKGKKKEESSESTKAEAGTEAEEAVEEEEEVVDEGDALAQEAEEQSEAAMDQAERAEAQKEEWADLSRQEQDLRAQEQKLKRQRWQNETEQAALGRANSQDPSVGMKRQQVAQAGAVIAQKEKQLFQSQQRYEAEVAANRAQELALNEEQTAQNKAAKELEAKQFAHEVELAQMGLMDEAEVSSGGGGGKKGAEGGEGADGKASGPKGPRSEMSAAETAQQEGIDQLLNEATAQGIRMTQAEAEAQYAQTQAAQTAQATQATQAQQDSSAILASAATANDEILGQFATLAASIQAAAQSTIQTLISTAEASAKSTLDAAQKEAESKKQAAESEAKSVVEKAKAEAAKLEEPGNIVAEAEAKAKQIITAMEAAVKQIIATAQATAQQILTTAQQNVAAETQTAAANTASAGQAAAGESSALVASTAEQVNQSVAASQTATLQAANTPPEAPPMMPGGATAGAEATATTPTNQVPTAPAASVVNQVQVAQESVNASEALKAEAAAKTAQAQQPVTPASDPMARFNQRAVNVAQPNVTATVNAQAQAGQFATGSNITNIGQAQASANAHLNAQAQAGQFATGSNITNIGQAQASANAHLNTTVPNAPSGSSPFSVGGMSAAHAASPILASGFGNPLGGIVNAAQTMFTRFSGWGQTGTSLGTNGATATPTPTPNGSMSYLPFITKGSDATTAQGGWGNNQNNAQVVNQNGVAIPPQNNVFNNGPISYTFSGVGNTPNTNNSTQVGGSTIPYTGTETIQATTPINNNTVAIGSNQQLVRDQAKAAVIENVQGMISPEALKDTKPAELTTVIVSDPNFAHLTPGDQIRVMDGVLKDLDGVQPEVRAEMVMELIHHHEQIGLDKVTDTLGMASSNEQNPLNELKEIVGLHRTLTPELASLVLPNLEANRQLSLLKQQELLGSVDNNLVAVENALDILNGVNPENTNPMMSQEEQQFNAFTTLASAFGTNQSKVAGLMGPGAFDATSDMQKYSQMLGVIPTNDPNLLAPKNPYSEAEKAPTLGNYFRSFGDVYQNPSLVQARSDIYNSLSTSAAGWSHGFNTASYLGGQVAQNLNPFNPNASLSSAFQHGYALTSGLGQVMAAERTEVEPQVAAGLVTAPFTAGYNLLTHSIPQFWNSTQAYNNAPSGATPFYRAGDISWGGVNIANDLTTMYGGYQMASKFMPKKPDYVIPAQRPALSPPPKTEPLVLDATEHAPGQWGVGGGDARQIIPLEGSWGNNGVNVNNSPFITGQPSSRPLALPPGGTGETSMKLITGQGNNNLVNLNNYSPFSINGEQPHILQNSPMWPRNGVRYGTTLEDGPQTLSKYNILSEIGPLTGDVTKNVGTFYDLMNVHSNAATNLAMYKDPRLSVEQLANFQASGQSFIDYITALHTGNLQLGDPVLSYSDLTSRYGRDVFGGYSPEKNTIEMSLHETYPTTALSQLSHEYFHSIYKDGLLNRNLSLAEEEFAVMKQQVQFANATGIGTEMPEARFFISPQREQLMKNMIAQRTDSNGIPQYSSEPGSAYIFKDVPQADMDKFFTDNLNKLQNGNLSPVEEIKLIKQIRHDFSIYDKNNPNLNHYLNPDRSVPMNSRPGGEIVTSLSESDVTHALIKQDTMSVNEARSLVIQAEKLDPQLHVDNMLAKIPPGITAEGAKLLLQDLEETTKLTTSRQQVVQLFSKVEGMDPLEVDRFSRNFVAQRYEKMTDEQIFERIKQGDSDAITHVIFRENNRIDVRGLQDKTGLKDNQLEKIMEPKAIELLNGDKIAPQGEKFMAYAKQNQASLIYDPVAEMYVEPRTGVPVAYGRTDGGEFNWVDTAMKAQDLRWSQGLVNEEGFWKYPPPGAKAAVEESAQDFRKLAPRSDGEMPRDLMEMKVFKKSPAMNQFDPTSFIKTKTNPDGSPIIYKGQWSNLDNDAVYSINNRTLTIGTLGGMSTDAVSSTMKDNLSGMPNTHIPVKWTTSDETLFFSYQYNALNKGNSVKLNWRNDYLHKNPDGTSTITNEANPPAQKSDFSTPPAENSHPVIHNPATPPIRGQSTLTPEQLQSLQGQYPHSQISTDMNGYPVIHDPAAPPVNTAGGQSTLTPEQLKSLQGQYPHSQINTDMNGHPVIHDPAAPPEKSDSSTPDDRQSQIDTTRPQFYPTATPAVAIAQVKQTEQVITEHPEVVELTTTYGTEAVNTVNQLGAEGVTVLKEFDAVAQEIGGLLPDDTAMSRLLAERVSSLKTAENSDQRAIILTAMKTEAEVALNFKQELTDYPSQRQAFVEIVMMPNSPEKTNRLNDFKRNFEMVQAIKQSNSLVENKALLKLANSKKEGQGALLAYIDEQGNVKVTYTHLDSLT